MYRVQSSLSSAVQSLAFTMHARKEKTTFAAKALERIQGRKNWKSLVLTPKTALHIQPFAAYPS